MKRFTKTNVWNTLIQQHCSFIQEEHRAMMHRDFKAMDRWSSNAGGIETAAMEIFGWDRQREFGEACCQAWYETPTFKQYKVWADEIDKARKAGGVVEFKE